MGVHVGRSTLGRLFNVLGATIDAYNGIDELPIYSDYPVSFDQYEGETSTHINQKVQFKAMGCKTIKIYDYNSYNENKLREGQQTSDLKLKAKEANDTQTIQLESLGLVCIMGIGAEIIKTRES